ncbi:hypothetical protein E3J62_07605 [candidate division TA06 bacterium]|uniref:DUF6946 domain-containing protein n=1 Tax=candidate division TA06 bacterium TaxID=2250710 RepID=A0A523US93_UNCT6|nr:MAG: hypothetical protein E3J62_07605 [candidate division TA06 bacterium]
MEICFGNTGVKDFLDMLNKVSNSDLCKLTCSTVPLLWYWKDYAERIRDLLEEIGAEFTEPSRLHFEYPVESANDLSKASYTDVMFWSKAISVAIEGKWREPRYETVQQWLRSGNTENRKAVLEHWKGLIAPKSRGIGNVDDVVYQMLHRTASACVQKSDRTVVLYQVFSDPTSKDVDYGADFETLVKAISPKEDLGIWLQYIVMYRTDHYRKTENTLLGIVDSERKASLAREAILEGDLFRFETEDFKTFPG